MPIFLYQSKKINGEEIKGEIEAADLRTAVATLRKRGLIIISVALKSSYSIGILDRFFNRVSFTELVTITRQLATMVGAGLVLSEAIDILEEQQDNKKLKAVFEEISHDIKSGLTLFQALSRHPDVFPQLYVNLIKSGETSGKLDEVLIKMADSLEKEREFKARVKGAMIYPIVVIIMMVGVIVLMIMFVIPKLTSLYSESALELPLPTKILISMSNFLISFWWVIIIAVVGMVLGLKRYISTPAGGFAFDNLVLKIPIIGKVITNVILTNFSRTFGLLIAAGIPLLDAINIVADITQNSVFRNSLKQSYNGVARGLPFSALLVSPIFPKIVPHMIRVGEETGKIDQIFFKLAEYFESEADHMVKNLTVAIEPIVLVILGLGVAFLAFSIILPIYKLTTSF